LRTRVSRSPEARQLHVPTLHARDAMHQCLRCQASFPDCRGRSVRWPVAHEAGPLRHCAPVRRLELPRPPFTDITAQVPALQHSDGYKQRATSSLSSVHTEASRDGQEQVCYPVAGTSAPGAQSALRGTKGMRAQSGHVSPRRANGRSSLGPQRLLYPDPMLACAPASG
jgi:hypothetical protein